MQTELHRERTSRSWTSRDLLARLWSEHISSHRGRLVSVLFLTAMVAGTTALYPLLISRAFSMFSAKDSRIIYQLPALVLVVMAVKSLTQYGQSVLSQQISLKVIRALQGSMFDHLTDTDLRRLERESPASLAARFTTDATLIRETLLRILNGVGDALTVVGLIASMLYFDWVLSLMSLVLYPLASVPIQTTGRRIRGDSVNIQEQTGQTATILNESFAQAGTVRAYRLEAMEKQRARHAFDQLYRALLRMNRSQSRVDPILEFVGGGAVALVVGFAGWRAANGSGDVSDFTGFVAALLVASRPLRALGSLHATMQEGVAGLARVFALIDERPSIVARPNARALPPGPGQLAFRDVSFTYADGRVGLDGLTFELKAGQTVALVGPSGAGKSTALALIPRLYDVTGGAVLIDGVDVRDVTLASLRDAIAYVPQDALLFDTTIAANIRMGNPAATENEISEAAEAAAAFDFISAMPDGFATKVGPGGQRLSGGQRQRVALARALLRNPRLLLLDEATSALDAESEAAIQLALSRLRHKRSTIVVAHRLSTVLSADLVIAISEGRSVEAGTHGELLSRDGLYARLVRSQAL